jgi:hypothetical protein
MPRQGLCQPGFTGALCTNHTDQCGGLKGLAHIGCTQSNCGIHTKSCVLQQALGLDWRALNRTQRGVATQVGQQDRWNVDRAVLILVVLQHRHQSAPHGQTRAVQGVHQLILTLGIFKASLQTLGLKALAIGHRTDLTVGVLRGQPDLKVVGFRSAKTHITGSQTLEPVRQSLFLQNGLGMSCHGLKRFVTALGVHDLHHLDFVKLVLANQPAYVASAATSL